MVACFMIAMIYSHFSNTNIDAFILPGQTSRAVNSKSSVGISSVTGRIWRPVHGKGPTEPIIKESARRPVTEKLPH